MTKEELKAKYPQTYKEIVQEGVTQERKEAETHLESEKAFNFKL